MQPTESTATASTSTSGGTGNVASGLERARELVKEVLQGLSGNEVFRSVRFSVDVDPY